jgi:hypothetical protein
MKRLTGVLLLCTLLALASDVIRELNSAIGQGNHRQIASYFNPNCELNIPGSVGTFTKVQAELLLRDFFSRNTPKNFEQKHTGKTDDGSLYCVGILTTRQGRYRAYYFLKKQNEQFKIKELRIEKER